jgi:hypothetical protein
MPERRKARPRRRCDPAGQVPAAPSPPVALVVCTDLTAPPGDLVSALARLLRRLRDRERQKEPAAKKAPRRK